MSAITLTKNRKGSSSKQRKHIPIRYYFIKDRVDSGDISIKYYLAAEMLVDHFTRPLQACMSRKFRAEIQGILENMPEIDVSCDRPDKYDLGNPTSQECISTSAQYVYVKKYTDSRNITLRNFPSVRLFEQEIYRHRNIAARNIQTLRIFQ